MKIQRLTIDDILKQSDTDPIWCINNTTQAMNARAGDLALVVPKLHGNGTPDKVSIPLTWLPFNLIRQVPRDQLVQSTEFRAAINSGLLIIVTPDYAEYLSHREGAAEERDRLQQNKDRVRNAVSRVVTEDESSVVSKALEDEQDAGYDPVFLMHVNQWNIMPDIEVLNHLRSTKHSRKQYEYLAKNLKNHPKTIAAIMRSLNKRKK